MIVYFDDRYIYSYGGNRIIFSASMLINPRDFTPCMNAFSLNKKKAILMSMKDIREVKKGKLFLLEKRHIYKYEL